jgi:hypothetical protein
MMIVAAVATFVAASAAEKITLPLLLLFTTGMQSMLYFCESQTNQSAEISSFQWSGRPIFRPEVSGAVKASRPHGSWEVAPRIA